MTIESMKECCAGGQRAEKIISALKSVSEKTGRSMAQVALAWLRHWPVPVITLIGARKAVQLQDNLASLDLELSAEQVQCLDEASRIELGLRGDLFARDSVRAMRYGGTWDRLLL
jgi:diketogulonate reductase-like aldo/keto reductase